MGGGANSPVIHSSRLSTGPKQPNAYSQFMLFGDSITQGDGNPDLGYSFAGALQNAYQRRLDVINRGFSGYNTKNALDVLPKFMPAPAQVRVLFMSLFFGANDAALPNTVGTHVPLDEYVKNLREIIGHATLVAQQPHLLIISPPPVDEYQFDHWDEPGKSGRNAKTTKRYADACSTVATELGIPLVDLWGAMMKSAGWTKDEPLVGSKDAVKNEELARLLYDGLHLSGEGYKILYTEMMATIRKHFPEQVPEKMPPAYEVVDWMV